MIFCETKLYLRYIAKSYNLRYDKSFLNVLHQYIDIVKDNGYRLDFHWWRHASLKALYCNAGYRKNSPIVATPGWATKLVFDDSYDTQNAFIMTLGHELTHKENDINPWRYLGRNQTFVAYSNEVHADFGAIVKFAESDRNKQIQAMEYKLNLKKDDKPSLAHPSWRQRIEYVKNYDFDEILIRKIAEDTNCHNEKLIQKVIEHFEPIRLK